MSEQVRETPESATGALASTRPASCPSPLPGVDVATAGILPVLYMTAWHMLRRADVSAGDRVFVPGATGGVGTAAVLLADVRGAEAIGTTTSERKADQLRDSGVDHVVESGDIDAIRGAVEGLANRTPS